MKIGRPRKTWESKIISFLSDKRCFTPLQEIYAGVGANSDGQQAGVRGILNRHTKAGAHLFKRKEKGTGFYALTAITKKCWIYFNKIF